ncbi:Ribonuclease D [Haemophilus influenzae]|uniref:Ribonuclease D n=1 Tax=Haemophilus influenzae (strain 86-028NP) TaxID=281310 RepID=Q4QNF1_HAEI8|nr:ribonuclease D [Haemophilus influenzae]AAX87446.1 ribonuclease D [Haemophilus influenzae 86-028NP]MBZ5693033.1 ribonuclease D [Haemophilus influenzae]MDF3110800.1 ribonuclease D [Haemophilus influenzae]MDF3122541.1 ribonuclease D [Haemophilus influenzae]PRI31321.1 Ribonuclease D [Haemophilus influenzae]
MIKECQNPPHFRVISDNAALLEICNLAQMKSAVALDTEFMRVSTYFPKLGLIQLYDDERVSLIDPLAITDFSPFVALLSNPKVLKILHSCSEDLLVFLQEFDQLPRPMIDTQIMARFLGLGTSAGLAKLAQQYLNIEIDKGATRTNWIKRPLSDIQLQYAAGDVWYLLPLYHILEKELAKTPWEQAVRDDCELALAKTHKLQERDSEKAYLDIPNAWKLNPFELSRLRILAQWRQNVAIERDLALSYIVKSDNLWKVAKNNPRNTSEMLEMGLTENEVRVRGKKILQLLAQARRVSPNDYPKPIERISEDPRYKKTIRLLQEKVNSLTPAGLTPEILASKRTLDELIKWVWKYDCSQDKLPELLIGWRKPIAEKLVDILK